MNVVIPRALLSVETAVGRLERADEPAYQSPDEYVTQICPNPADTGHPKTTLQGYGTPVLSASVLH